MIPEKNNARDREHFLLEKEIDTVYYYLLGKHAIRWSRTPINDDVKLASSCVDGICLWKKRRLPLDLEVFTDGWVVLAKRIETVRTTLPKARLKFEK